MRAREPYCRLVHTDAGWHAVIVAANHQDVFTTKIFTRRHPAQRAIDIVRWSGGFGPTRWVDERTKP